ncbi:MAG: DUF998 domain-containing protein [Methanosarcinales archaeon]|nr:DUF998 domain-containing protein [Methanosarcinales archaeon]
MFAAGVVVLLGIITAETLYPGYSTSAHQISDLGATQPPNSIIVQPSATIFDSAMVVSGLLIAISAYFVHRAFGRRSFSILLAAFGLGALGVGIFNGSYGNLHAIMALITFVGGGLSAVASSRITKPPFSHFSAALGAITLLTLLQYFLLGESSPFLVLGIGGLERWIAYPIVLWIIGFGGYLMGSSRPSGP